MFGLLKEGPAAKPNMHTRLTKETLPAAIRHLKAVDPVLGSIIDRVGKIEIHTKPNTVDSLVGIIANQQLSGTAAATIFKRVQALNKGKALTVAALQRLTDEQIRGAGMSYGKIRTIRAVCDSITCRKLNLKKLELLPDEEVFAAITSVKGKGPWSAQMYLMFVLNRPDIFSPGDGGIQKALRVFYKAKTERKIATITAKWQPYRTVACLYLWRGLE